MAASRAGIRVVFNHLDSIADKVRTNATRITGDTARAITAAAQSQVPVDTGELRGSIQATQVGNKWQVTAGTDHAVYVEYGTAKHGAAQPFMTPAAHHQEPVFIDKLKNIIPGA